MTLLLLILAHLIADFWLQTDRMVMDKRKNITKHVFHHLLCTSIALWMIWFTEYRDEKIIFYFILPLIFIVSTHIIIDYVKISLIDSIKLTKTDNMRSLAFFLIDQLLHIGMIFATCAIFYQINGIDYISAIISPTYSLSPIEICIFLIIIFMMATNVTGHIVKHIIGSLPSELANFEGKLIVRNEMNHQQKIYQPRSENQLTEEYRYLTYSSTPQARGKYIGYIERLLVIVLTAVGAYSSIAFIIAAKSIARFKQLDDRNWAEYFLLGTLSSIFIGILLGLIVQTVLL